MLRFFLAVGSLCLMQGTVHAAAIEKLENIRQTVHDFATAEIGGSGRNITIKVGRLDPRLRLNECGEPLTAYMSAGTRMLGHTSIGVRCAGPKAWSLFVPLHVDRQIKVAVATAPLSRGHVVTAADVSYELRSVARLNGGYFAAKDPLIGKVCTRPINRGHVFSQNMVDAARLVKRGDRVVLALHNGSVAVRVAGTALSDGALGERVSVRNLSSKRIIEGVVHEAGVVLIGATRATR